MSMLNARMRTITAAITIVMMPTLAQADIYKWVDAKGQVHFSDAAPQNVNATTVQTTSKAQAPKESANTQTLLERQQRFTRKLEKERKAREALIAKEKARQEKRDATCQRARNQLEHFKSVHRFYQENPDGTITYLSDKEGDRFRRDAQASYEKRCRDEMSIAHR